MRIYVTGVSGFVGGFLAEQLRQAGHTVLGCGSSDASRLAAPDGLARFDALRLGTAAPDGTFAELDVVIHAAYAPGKAQEAVNVDGTVAWARQAARESAPHQIFLSSHSADAAASSAYGRQKYALERFFLDHGHIVLRLGLVIGDGGLFRRMADLMRRLPVLPMLDGGRAPTPVTSPADLAQIVARLLDTAAPPGNAADLAHNLFNAEPVSLRALLLELRRALGRRTLFLPIPSAILVPPLVLARRLGVPLPVDEENLRGYRANRGRLRASDYGRLRHEPTPFTTMVDAAAAAYLSRLNGSPTGKSS